jgi:hypothetical protein
MPDSSPDDARPGLSEAQRLARSIGGYTTAARCDTRQITAPARTAFLSKFEAEVDPDGLLPTKERERRAKAARQAYFKRLALLSVMARRRR